MSNLEVAHKGLRAFESNDVATVTSLLADDFTFSGAVPHPLGKQEFLGFMHLLMTAFPDFRFNEVLTEDGNDTVIVTQRITGTHTGPLALPWMPPLAATGKHVALPPEKQIFTFRDGQFAKTIVEPTPGGGIPGILAQVGAEMPD